MGALKGAARRPALPPGDEPELRAALALAAAPGLSPARVRRLVDRVGSPSGALRALAAGERGTAGLPAKLVARLRSRGLEPAPRPRLAELASRGVRLVAYGTRGYPPRLLPLHHPPTVLYLRGPRSLPEGPAVAIVGTRRATEYGRRVARGLAADLAAAGCAVVSGLARGIDAAAHRGALEAEGETVGVLGSGLDHVFPASSRPLFAALEGGGLLVSEFPPELPPARGLFPRRNRIIAGLADALVVVQAGEKSGALITVDHALELGREVFAVPGPVDLPASAGVNGLLRDGARPATGALDVLRGLGDAAWRETASGDPEGALAGEGCPPPSQTPAGPGRETRALLAALAGGARGADELAAEAGVPIARVLAILGRLELSGLVRALPGARFAAAGH